jgi:hypothetical protein
LICDCPLLFNSFSAACNASVVFGGAKSCVKPCQLPKRIRTRSGNEFRLLLRLNSESSCCKFWRPGAQCARVSLRALCPNGSALAVLNQPEMRIVETGIISFCDGRRRCAGIKQCGRMTCAYTCRFLILFGVLSHFHDKRTKSSQTQNCVYQQRNANNQVANAM